MQGNRVRVKKIVLAQKHDEFTARALRDVGPGFSGTLRRKIFRVLTMCSKKPLNGTI